MANKNGRIVRIEENNQAPKTPTTPDNEKNETPAEEEVKYTLLYCLCHPIKSYRHAAEKHPVVTTVCTVGLTGGLIFVGKVIVDAINDGKPTENENEEDDVLADPLEEETEDEEI